LAFADVNRLIVPDLEHSAGEERWYCFGKVGKRVMTVRFTYRGKKIRIIGAAYWRKGLIGAKARKHMKKNPDFDKEGYESAPFGKKAKFGKKSQDFLPAPDKLHFKVKRENIEPVDIWLPLSKKTVDYFKNLARTQKSDYRLLIASFVEQHLPIQ
jgi:hypothetical protein